MNSELITKNDLASILGNLGIRDHVGTQIATGTATVNAAKHYILCTLQLPPNSKFLILGFVYEGQTADITSTCTISCPSGDLVESLNFGWNARTKSDSGQGVANWAYAKTGDGGATITLWCHGYYTTSHVATGHLLTIQFLDNLTISEIASEAGTYIPTINKTAKFDMAAHMNSEDMTSSELDEFIGGLQLVSETYDFTGEFDDIILSVNTSALTGKDYELTQALNSIGWEDLL